MGLCCVNHNKIIMHVFSVGNQATLYNVGEIDVSLIPHLENVWM